MATGETFENGAADGARLGTPGVRTVFISHHSSQYAAAKEIKAALAQGGIRGWLAPDDIDPGSAFDTQILEAMREADALVLLLCPQSDRSRHVKREVMLADDADKPVFPVRMEPVQAEGLAYWLKDYQWIDWFGAKGDGLDRLVASVGGATTGPATGHARDMPPAAARPRRRWLIAGGALAVLGVAGVAAWLLIPAAPEPVVRPGLWLNKREMISISYPADVPPEETRQIKEMVENDPNPEECIPEAVALNPDVKLFDPGNKGGCTVTGFQMASGRLSGFLVCPIKAVKDAAMSIVFKGTYSKESIVMESDITLGQPAGSLRFKARDSSHWIAETCTENR